MEKTKTSGLLCASGLACPRHDRYCIQNWIEICGYIEQPSINVHRWGGGISNDFKRLAQTALISCFEKSLHNSITLFIWLNCIHQFVSAPWKTYLKNLYNFFLQIFVSTKNTL